MKTFKYSYPDYLVYILFFITFLFFYASFNTISDDNDDPFIHLLTVTIAIATILVTIRWRRPGSISLHPNSINCKIFSFFRLRNYSVSYDQVEKAYVIQLQNSPGIRLVGPNGSVDINLSNIPLEDLGLFTTSLQRSLSLHGHRIENFSEVTRIINLWSNGSARFATKIIFLSVVGLAVNSAHAEYYERQILNEYAGIPIFIVCLFLSFCFYKKWRSFDKGVFASVFASIPVFLFSSLICCGVFSFFNQRFDTLSPDIVVISVNRIDTPDYKKEANCFSINEAHLKDDFSWMICDDTNPRISETSIVEVSFKRGSFGQRWIASAKLLDKEGLTDIKFD